ncbi:MAG TPA: N-acetylmuramoyl-L-alanine amidase, partial [Chthoniobacter sp.]|nr:N-acetylmuramoyl-L-alanine amidase [Chthoniobacter sp.]
LPWMVLAVTAYGQVRPADVLYTHYDTAPTRGYRVGEEVFVPVDEVAKWDWQVTMRADLAIVKAEGIEFNVPTRTFNGRLTLPLIAAVKKAGGQAAWDRNSDTLSIYSELTSIRVQDGRIKVTSPFKVLPRIFVDQEQQRLVLEFSGSRLGQRTQQFLGENSVLSQVQANVVRLVLQTDRLPDLSTYKPSASFSFELDLPVPKEIIQPPAAEEQKTVPPPVIADPPIVIAPTVTPILQVILDKESERGLSLSIPLAQKLNGSAQARKPEPEILEITLPGIAMVLPEGFKLESENVKDVTRTYDGIGTVLRFQFTRPMAAQMWMEGNTVKISALKPSVTGTLMGKVIVVDPGHGGADGGAKGGTLKEKDLNLIMGKLIAERLTEEGATVIMTRKTDVFIPLNTRAKIANDSDADLFISSHINSTGGSGSQSGTITFHHLGQQISRLLAECIHREVSVVNGLPDIGVWSDGKIYNSGFAVLRNTKMPGVLLELGFINHPTDRARLATKDFQEKVAVAVVKGIKVFLGDGR